MENGISPSVPTDSCSFPIVAIAAADRTPAAIPSVVESGSGPICSKKTGPKPVANSLRMQLLMDFVGGKLPSGRDDRINFIRDCHLTPREKSYLVKHEFFKDLYDERLFDMFLGIAEATKADLQLLHIIGMRIGLSRQISMNVKNMQMNNGGKNAKVNIKVRRE